MTARKRSENPEVPRALPLAALLAAFLGLSLYFIWRLMPGGQLTGDEVFYYFQALNLRSFNLVWFSDTSPYLYPLVLALSGFNSPAFLRTAGALLFCLSGFLVYRLTLRLSGDREGAFWAAGLLLFFHETLNLSTQLFTEAAFTPLFLALLLAYRRQREKGASGCGGLLLGLLAGLLAGARVVGVVFAFYIFLHWLLRPGEDDRRRIISAIAIAVLAAAGLSLPFLLATYSPHSLISCMLQAHTRDSLFANPPAGLLAHFLPWRTGGYSICAAALIAAWPVRRASWTRFLAGMGAVYLAFEAVLDVNFYPRHLYPLFIISCLLIGRSFSGLAAVKRWPLRAVILAFMVFSSWSFAARFPALSPNNFYFPDGKAGAMELAAFRQTGADGGVKEVVLPYFSQPYYSRYTYRAVFDCARGYDHVFINYISDRVRVRADGRELTSGFAGGPFYPLAISWPFKPGRHELEIEVDSDVMLNGLGQVLLVDEDFMRRRVRPYARQPG